MTKRRKRAIVTAEEKPVTIEEEAVAVLPQELDEPISLAEKKGEEEKEEEEVEAPVPLTAMEGSILLTAVSKPVTIEYKPMSLEDWILRPHGVVSTKPSPPGNRHEARILARRQLQVELRLGERRVPSKELEARTDELIRDSELQRDYENRLDELG